MTELGIDIAKQKLKSFQIILKDEFDYVITVCDSEKKLVPLLLVKLSTDYTSF